MYAEAPGCKGQLSAFITNYSYVIASSTLTMYRRFVNMAGKNRKKYQMCNVNCQNCLQVQKKEIIKDLKKTLTDFKYDTSPLKMFFFVHENHSLKVLFLARRETNQNRLKSTS